MRYFLHLAYNGASYCGWQRQPNALSVQQTLEEALQTMLRHPVSLTGAGRTDTGVNARMMYAHFDVEDPLWSGEESLQARGRILASLRKLCGPAIAVEEIIPVADTLHARFDALSRTYKYFIAFKYSPFLRSESWWSPSGLDVDMMQAGAERLLSVSDFTSFAKLHSDAKTNICRLMAARWDEWCNDFGVPGLVFTIKADRFLRNMVRAVVGTLVDMGRGKISLEKLDEIIERKDRCAAGTSMPAQALYLWDIEYPQGSFNQKIID